MEAVETEQGPRGVEEFSVPRAAETYPDSPRVKRFQLTQLDSGEHRVHVQRISTLISASLLKMCRSGRNSQFSHL